MSYDVHLIRFQDGDAVPVVSATAWRLLEEAWEVPPNEFQHCRVRRDGDEADVYGLESDAFFGSSVTLKSSRHVTARPLELGPRNLIT